MSLKVLIFKFSLSLSIGSLSRARKNVKLIQKGEEAGDDKTTDYDQPRKRKLTDRFRINEDDDPVKIKRNKPKFNVNRILSDSSDNAGDSDVPPPKTNIQELQSKLSKALALRTILPKAKGKVVPKVAKDVQKFGKCLY